MEIVDIDGRELKIQESSFINAMALKHNLGKVLNIKELDLNLDIDDPLKTDISTETIGGMLENMISVATDPNIMKSLFKCCEKVVFLDDEIINESFFNKKENRGLYYPIMLEVLKVNILPFFEKISSMFTGVSGLMGKLQKQK